MLIGINVCVTQLLWFKKIRSNLVAAVHHRPAHQLRHVERTLRHRRRLAVSGFSAGELGQLYRPTIWDIGLYVGTLGAFFMLYLLFVKFLPVIAISEVKGAMPQGDPHHPLGGAQKGGHR